MAENTSGQDLLELHDNFTTAATEHVANVDVLNQLQESGASKSEIDAALEAANESAKKASEAQAAFDTANKEARPTDRTYVVHVASISCSYGMRDSYAVLETTHGVYIKQIPQLTVKDMMPDLNVINFGGCNSKENPDTVAVAERLMKEVRDSSNFFEKVIDFFTSDKIEESFITSCYGECKPQIAGITWSKGKENVTINGEKPLLRRSELRCAYGGQIIIELSGQP